MKTVNEIMDMLDWNLAKDIQEKGIKAADGMKDISPFFQPLTQKYNKNVWDNCAKIISNKSDLELKDHLRHLLEWIQDMNWPGAWIILNRLKSYNDSDSFYSAIEICLKCAKEENDTIWYDNLLMLMQNR